MVSAADLRVVVISYRFLQLFKILTKAPKAILNVYQRPNGFFWLKTLFMFILIKLRQLRPKKVDYEALDKPQPLSHHEKAIDAVYFNGASSKGDHLVLGTARRKAGLIDGFLYLKIASSGLGLLETPKLPDTSLYQDQEKESFEAEGIKVTPEEPMKKWSIKYNGKMKSQKGVHDVVLNLNFTSDLPVFNFDCDMHPLTMAKSMAHEVWSREYFKNLEENHQTHYEQHGKVNGTAIIDGKSFSVDLDTVRDHSFGKKREWRNFHRYGLHFFSAANGDRFSVGMICLPISFSRFTMGYVYKKSDNKIYPVTSCDLELYQHGEDDEPPVDYAFTFYAGGQRYTVQVDVVDSPHFYISKDWESKVVERLAKFEINGIKGWGAAEWQYRNIEGRDVKQ